MLRDDLPDGFREAQVVHASYESAAIRAPRPGVVDHAVVLAVSGGELRALHEELTRAGIPHAAIVEDDAPWTGILTAIGVAPGTPNVKRFLRPLRKLGARKEAPA